MDFRYSCSLERVIDGDTVVMVVDLGFRMSATLPIRLAGLNAPERSTPEGKNALTYVTGWFKRRPGPYTLVSSKNPEKYGRWLGEITSADGHQLNHDLISAGHAVAWDGHGPRPVPS